MKWRVMSAAIVIMLSAVAVSGAETATEPMTAPASGPASVNPVNYLDG